MTPSPAPVTTPEPRQTPGGGFTLLLALLCFALLGTAPVRGADTDKPAFKAGVATKVITPTEPMWMAGYASRKEPAKEKTHDLFVKAIAIEAASGGKLVLLTSDLVGIPRGLSEEVAAEVQKKTGLSRDRLMLTCSHTHCGPVIRDNLADMYEMPEEEAKKINPYTDKLRGWMVEVITKALDDLKPAKLSVGKGTARFAVNRREPTDKGIINGFNPKGPVDHDVPVLKVESPEGKLRAVVFGYACHNTTMQFLQWCGDYAGFAMANLEEKHPGAMALFWIGCGADANPLPRSKIELCQKYGKELADAVEDVIGGKMIPVTGSVASHYETIAIPFDTLPTKDQFAADLLSKTHAVRKRAERFVKVLEDGKKIDTEYRYYPVQAWRIGDVLWLALGGEVVVDYSMRLKKELGEKRTVWVTGYANDVMAYIPSARVLKEGGYEADSSQVYYGQPTKWAPEIEEKIVKAAHAAAKAVQK